MVTLWDSWTLKMARASTLCIKSATMKENFPFLLFLTHVADLFGRWRWRLTISKASSPLPKMCCVFSHLPHLIRWAFTLHTNHNRVTLCKRAETQVFQVAFSLIDWWFGFAPEFGWDFTPAPKPSGLIKEMNSGVFKVAQAALVWNPPQIPDTRMCAAILLEKKMPF